MLQELINNLAFADFLHFECISEPFKALGCPGFWFNYLIVAEILLLFVVYKVIKYFLGERKLMKEFYKRQERKAMVADKEVLEKVSWKNDENFDEVAQTELATQMRSELAKTKGKSK